MILLEICTRAARMAGLLKRPGVGLNGSEQDECLAITNAMIDGLKTERLFVYQVLRTQVQVITGKQEYRVGDLALGADWVVPYFERLYGAGFLTPNQPITCESEIPMDVLLSWQQWQAITVKKVTSSQPRWVWYQATLPTGTATLWPVPYVDSQMVIYSPGHIQEFSDIADQVVFPQGYREFFEYELAVKINDGYPGLIMKPGVEQKAVMYKSRVRAYQLKPSFMRSDPAALSANDPYAVGYYGAREWPGSNYQ